MLKTPPRGEHRRPTFYSRPSRRWFEGERSTFLAFAVGEVFLSTVRTAGSRLVLGGSRLILGGSRQILACDGLEAVKLLLGIRKQGHWMPRGEYLPLGLVRRVLGVFSAESRKNFGGFLTVLGRFSADFSGFIAGFRLCWRGGPFL